MYLIRNRWCSEMFTYVYVYWITNSGSKIKNAFRVRKISPKFCCTKFFQIRDVPTQIPAHPGHSLSKTTEKATCINLLSGISRRLGPGCPRNILPKIFIFRMFFSFLKVRALEHAPSPSLHGPTPFQACQPIMSLIPKREGKRRTDMRFYSPLFASVPPALNIKFFFFFFER